MIRLQNGNSVVLQADNEQEALEFAGLRADASPLTEHMKARGEDADPAEVQLLMMQSGLGPQNCTIRELNEFHCAFNLQDDGTFSAPDWMAKNPPTNSIWTIRTLTRQRKNGPNWCPIHRLCSKRASESRPRVRRN